MARIGDPRHTRESEYVMGRIRDRIHIIEAFRNSRCVHYKKTKKKGRIIVIFPLGNLFKRDRDVNDLFVFLSKVAQAMLAWYVSHVVYFFKPWAFTLIDHHTASGSVVDERHELVARGVEQF